MIHYTLTSLVRRSSTSAIIGTDALHTSSTTGDIRPSGAETTTSAGKETFFFLFGKVIVKLLLIKTGSAEQHDDKHDEEDAKESKLSPEVDKSEEGEVDGDAVQEGTNYRRRADHTSDRVVSSLATRADSAVVVATVWLRIGVVGRSVAVGLRAEGGILRSDHHSDSVVDGEYNQGEHDSSHKKGLRSSVTLANLEQTDPQEADTDRGNTDNRSGKEQKGQKKENDIVDGEDLRGNNEKPVDGLEDLVVAKQISTASLAHRVFDLVDAGDQHAGPDDENDNYEQKTTEEFQGSENGFGLEPHTDEPV